MLMMVRLNQRSRPPSSWIKYWVGTGTAADDAGVEPVIALFAAVDVEGAVVRPEGVYKQPILILNVTKAR